jgi:hypothetical protein
MAVDGGGLRRGEGDHRPGDEPFEVKLPERFELAAPIGA